MGDKTPEALELAEDLLMQSMPGTVQRKASEELRRQHQRIWELEKVLKVLMNENQNYGLNTDGMKAARRALLSTTQQGGQE